MARIDTSETDPRHVQITYGIYDEQLDEVSKGKEPYRIVLEDFPAWRDQEARSRAEAWLAGENERKPV